MRYHKEKNALFTICSPIVQKRSNCPNKIIVEKLEEFKFQHCNGERELMEKLKNQSVKISGGLVELLDRRLVFRRLAGDQVADRPDSNVAQASLPGSRSVADIVETVGPAVVYIEATGSRSMDRTDICSSTVSEYPQPVPLPGRGLSSYPTAYSDQPTCYRWGQQHKGHRAGKEPICSRYCGGVRL